MAFKASPVVPQKRPLGVDPEDSWVYVRPATQRMNLMRAELLRGQEFDTRGVYLRATVNPVVLQNKELWLSSPASDPDWKEAIAHVAVDYYDDGEKTKTKVFFEKAPEGGWTEAKFYQELEKLPPMIVSSWVVEVHGVNQGWVLPFA